jgi:hypothetical protein
VDLFKEIIPSLTSKKPVLETQEDFKNYVPFIINRYFSQYPTDIFFAQEMNKRSFLDKQMQHDFYMAAVRPGKRPFVPWVKKAPKNEDIELVQKTFGYSYRRAAETMKMFTEEQLEEFRQDQDIGGK